MVRTGKNATRKVVQTVTQSRAARPIVDSAGCPYRSCIPFRAKVSLRLVSPWRIQGVFYNYQYYDNTVDGASGCWSCKIGSPASLYFRTAQL
jgi:hypothetical protein